MALQVLQEVRATVALPGRRPAPESSYVGWCQVKALVWVPASLPIETQHFSERMPCCVHLMSMSELDTLPM